MASPAPRTVDVEGYVVLDGAPAPVIPVLIGTRSVPLDGVDGCPPVPAYASCVVTGRDGRLRARVDTTGLVPIAVDLDAAARRAGRPRAVGGAIEVDLDAAAPHGLRLEVSGAELEL